MPNSNHTDAPYLYRLPDVQRLLGLGRSAVYALRAINPDFPRPVRLSSRAIAWRRDELEAWVESLPRVDQPATPAPADNS